MSDPIEIISDEGDLYIVRECDEGTGCVALEHLGRGTSDGRDGNAPTQEFHLSADVAFDLGRALQQFARVRQ
jgi:hypothetical protein